MAWDGREVFLDKLLSVVNYLRMAPATETRDIHRAIELLQRLTDLFQVRRRELSARVGLSEAQWRVLEEIASEHFMPSVFARERQSTPAAVSKVLRQLLDKGLVEVEVAAGDGRQRHYRLSRHGQVTMERLRGYRERAIAEIWSDLPAEQVAAFNVLGDALVARIESYRDAD